MLDFDYKTRLGSIRGEIEAAANALIGEENSETLSAGHVAIAELVGEAVAIAHQAWHEMGDRGGKSAAQLALEAILPHRRHKLN